jgi:hypothetical protein
LDGPEPRAFGHIPKRQKSRVKRNVIENDGLSIEERSTAGTPIPDRYATKAIEKLFSKTLLNFDLQVTCLPVDELNVAQLLTGNNQGLAQR